MKEKLPKEEETEKENKYENVGREEEKQTWRIKYFQEDFIEEFKIRKKEKKLEEKLWIGKEEDKEEKKSRETEKKWHI